MKIQNDVQILQKATDVRDKTRNADLIGLSNQLNEAEEARLKVETHLEEKEKVCLCTSHNVNLLF